MVAAHTGGARSCASDFIDPVAPFFLLFSLPLKLDNALEFIELVADLRYLRAAKPAQDHLVIFNGNFKPLETAPPLPDVAELVLVAILFHHVSLEFGFLNRL